MSELVGLFLFNKMAITKDKKKEIVEKVSSVLKKAKSAVFVNFHGLKVADVTALRKVLREQGIGYTVAKKTLITRALEEQKINGVAPTLDGEIAVAYAEDMLAPAREIYVFEKKLKDTLKIVGGIFEGAYADREKMLSIATIPPLDVLRGMFLNVINSPIQRTAIVLSEIAKKKGAGGSNN